MSGWSPIADARWSLLVGLVACASPAASPQSRSLPRPVLVSDASVRSQPVASPSAPAVVRSSPVVDAEQRAILDALDEVARALETPRELAELAAALGTPIATGRMQGWLEITPRAEALDRIRIEFDRRSTENRLEITVRTPTNAAILGTRFGALIEEGFLREFGDAYWLTRCRPLPDGASISIDVFFDGTPRQPETEATSIVFVERWPPAPYRTCSP